MTIGVTVADDQRLVQEGFAAIVSCAPDLKLVAQAANQRARRTLAEELGSDPGPVLRRLERGYPCGELLGIAQDLPSSIDPQKVAEDIRRAGCEPPSPTTGPG